MERKHALEIQKEVRAIQIAEDQATETVTWRGVNYRIQREGGHVRLIRIPDGDHSSLLPSESGSH